MNTSLFFLRIGAYFEAFVKNMPFGDSTLTVRYEDRGIVGRIEIIVGRKVWTQHINTQWLGILIRDQEIALAAQRAAEHIQQQFREEIAIERQKKALSKERMIKNDCL